MDDHADRLYERLLIVRCQTGDEGAYRELVSRFGPRLRYFLRKLVTRPDRADDVAQEVWLDVVRQLPRLRDAGAFKVWLYRIARGKAMLAARRNGRAPETSTDVDQVPEKSEVGFSPEDAARIHAALDRLDHAQREVLVLRFLEDMSYDEIARIVDCPIGTVRSRLHYAKAALHRLLKHDRPDN